MARRSGCGCSARTSSFSATAKGRVGVLDEYCSHRRASLLFARNEECGLRCLYHGWKFDVEGNVVEMASEPPTATFLNGSSTRPIRRARPADSSGPTWGRRRRCANSKPPAFAPTADARVSATKVRVRCNWAQILEGQIDSAHSSSLHSSDMVPAQVDGAKATEANWLRPSTDKAPRFQIERTSYGFRYAAIRRPIKNEATHDYIRTTVYIAPFTALIPPNNVHNVATLLTPEDDHNTIFYFIAWNGPDKTGIDADSWRKFNVLQWGVDVDSNFDGVRTRANLYRQDRAAMKQGNFTGISGIPNQDIAMWESMGPISDRSKERVGASDVAVVAFRRLMVEAARAMRSKGQAIGKSEPHVRQATISSYEGVVPKTTNWRSLGGGSEAPLEHVAKQAQAAK